MKPSEQKNTHLTDIDVYSKTVRDPLPWKPLLLAIAIIIAIMIGCTACVPPAKGGYGNSNGQPPATMTTASGYTGQAGS